MQLVEQHIIKKSNPLYKELDAMSFLSKNLYNQALYRIRRVFFETSKYLNYNTLVGVLTKERQVDYVALPRKVSQWVLKQVDKNFISFFKSLKSEKVEHKVHIPRYLDKKGRNLLTFTNQAISKKELSKGYLKLSGCNNKLKIKHTNVQQVRVVSSSNCYVVEVVYNQKEQKLLNNNNYAGVDIGLNNLATVGFNKAKPVIINGRPLKAINQYYNKKLSKLKSRQNKCGNKKVNSKKIKGTLYLVKSLSIS